MVIANLLCGLNKIYLVLTKFIYVFYIFNLNFLGVLQNNKFRISGMDKNTSIIQSTGSYDQNPSAYYTNNSSKYLYFNIIMPCFQK